ncbi:MAG: hypothetical protein OJF61_002488 [Rhodanobacteraceae bacterium]|nr:MAG: hypothetical protein OJF61_002488 [Rhodanobacteraceae bacterium]
MTARRHASTAGFTAFLPPYGFCLLQRARKLADCTRRSTMRINTTSRAAILTLVGSLVCTFAIAMPPALRSGMWNAHATYLWVRPIEFNPKSPPSPINVPSPDGTKLLSVLGNRLTVKSRNGAVLAAPIEIESLAGVEWAPNSQRFEVTESDAGVVGTWSTVVYDVTPLTLRRHDVGSIVAAQFLERPGACTEQPNIVTSGWLGSEKLLIVAQAPDHSSCGKDMGAIRGYEVRATDGHVLHVYDASDLREKFAGLIGPLLRVP